MQRFGAVLLILVGATIPVFVSAEPITVEPPRRAWVGDRYSEMIFFAVLEGLYRDGVSNDVVDLVLGTEPSTGGRDHFVYACPLCSPALEAFRLYRERPPFEGLKSRVDTLGPGSSPGLEEKLRSTIKQERLDAVQGLIESWVSRRLELMRLTSAEQQEWADNLEMRRKAGMEQLIGREDWKNCAICDGSVKACRRIRRAPQP